MFFNNLNSEICYKPVSVQGYLVMFSEANGEKAYNFSPGCKLK